MTVAGVIEDGVLKEKVFFRKIEPGFTAFVLPKQGFQKKYAVISTNFGSIDREFSLQGETETIKVPDGVAHFLEHKLFEYEGGSVMDDFSRLGASSNAYTNFTNTAYLFSCTDNFKKNLSLLLNFVQETYFTNESIEREKNIIEQEIRMYEDNPSWRLFFNLLNGLYEKHPVKIDIAGTVKSIHKIDADILQKCHQTFYHPSNMAFFAVGDFNPEEILDQVEANIIARNYTPLESILRYYPKEPLKINQEKMTEQLVVSQPVFYLGFKDNQVGFLGENLLRKDIITDIILEVIFSSSAPLFNQLYEDGLIDDNFDASFTAHRDYGHVIIGGETHNPEELFQKTMQGIKEVQKNGITAKDFETKQKKMAGEFLKSFNSLEFIANNYLSSYFQEISMFDYLKILKSITKEEAEERLQQLFTAENYAISVIEPK